MSSNLVIVALPADDDPIWKISSEKKPHLTMLFLGDAESNPKVDRIFQFVSHAVNISEHGSFYLDVDRRGILGTDQADVLHFRKDWSFKWVNQFRNQLLQNTDIRAAYESVEQYPEWQPHLTLGYPETPAHEDKIPEYGINMVRFDRIAVWTGDYEGPWFKLEWPERDLDDVMAMSGTRKTGEEAIADLLHVGVKGMRWGVRKPPPSPVTPTATSKVPHGTKRKTKIEVDGGENHPASEDAIKVARAQVKLKKSGPAALSNQELRDLQDRLNLERSVTQLVGSTTRVSKGRQFVRNLTGINKEVNDTVNTGFQTTKLVKQVR